VVTYTHRRWHMVSLYSVMHFIVDFACAFLIFRNIAGTSDGYLCVLLYNFCAFALQMPLGILADKWNRNYLFAIIGCLVVGMAYGLWQVPVAAAVIIGIGNGMFHIGGGFDVLNISEDKSGALGVFVSPGAFGYFCQRVMAVRAGRRRFAHALVNRNKEGETMSRGLFSALALSLALTLVLVVLAHCSNVLYREDRS